MGRLLMIPACGERVRRFVGDRLRFGLRAADGAPLPSGWRAFLRTNLGRARAQRAEIIRSYPRKPPLAGAAWHDIPLFPDGAVWTREITLAETGYFRAKAYAVDPQGRQHWPDGPDVGVSIHPDAYRTGNTIYCAFVRLFGPSRAAVSTASPALEKQLAELDARGFTVIPPSGTLRDLVRQFPHIFDTLGCRILHLLPVTPTPTVFARFGRFGSPYAVQDLTAIDPALVEFDKRTTGIEQFCELTRAAHRRGGRVFLDIVINHTGWGSTLHERHPDWFVRAPGGQFVSPGAWGVTWEDLVELDHRHPELWEDLAEVFLTWCRRGVDGFRCDAGYKIPVEVWRYITARVLDDFPDTIFLLEGLGGSWEATEALLTEGSMQWAYSELFQNYSGSQVAWYLDYALRQCERIGLYVHYSETHDNPRLAAKGRAWSLLRNRLCALASVNGGFGFTCGVEWLATERINVHDCRGLAWGRAENLVPELARLNRLLREHPCFWDGAQITRLSPSESPVLALRRDAADDRGRVLVLVNTDAEREQAVALDRTDLGGPSPTQAETDLLGQPLPKWHLAAGNKIEFRLPPGGAFCLETARGPQPSGAPDGDSGQMTAAAYVRAHAQAAWAVQALSAVMPPEQIGPFDWRRLADCIDREPDRFLGTLASLKPMCGRHDLLEALEAAQDRDSFPTVVCWRVPDRRRVTPVPQDHWLLVEDTAPFRADLKLADGAVKHVQSIAVRAGHVAAFPPSFHAGDAVLTLERYADERPRVEATVRYLPVEPGSQAASRSGALLWERVESSPPPAGPPLGSADGTGTRCDDHRPPLADPAAVVLLTNGRGGMTRLCVDLGRITSKYDCLLGANLHPCLPVDRHIFAKRARVWINADGFITPLNGDNLIAFAPGPPACWRFVANAGDGRAVEIEMTAEMIEGRNTTVLRFHRPATPPPLGRPLPPEARVSLTVRVDIEDRDFHFETRRTSGAEHHFSAHCRPLPASVSTTADRAASGEGRAPGRVGFEFTPAPERQLRALCDRGAYHPEPEWCEHIPHPVEATRGLIAEGDAYSPGWFEIPVEGGCSATLVVTAERDDIEEAVFHSPFPIQGSRADATRFAGTGEPTADPFGTRLARAIKAFVVRRGEGRTIIAGYPWFLDWGRDTLVAARGLLAAGEVEVVAALLKTFARFEVQGTLPNALFGENASNRDTSDAPLWFGVVCEEFLDTGRPLPKTDGSGAGRAPNRAIPEVLRSIAVNYLRGTPNGICVDRESALVWSPAHFTWMDTNHPACTPREGYPVEIQALWVRVLRLLERLDLPSENESWRALADRAEASLLKLFWLEERGWLADVLIAPAGTPARQATPSDALRPNALFPVAFGLLRGGPARRCVAAARDHLLVPGGLRSLAPLPVTPPLPIHAPDGRLLNDPTRPYQGRYEGDEDTRRKPAYHNGTAWGWTLPLFCEALARAWDWQPTAVAAARAYLRSAEPLLDTGCCGQLPELLDGDAPHTPRGCDAQAWSVTEALRVWKLLGGGKRETQA